MAMITLRATQRTDFGKGAARKIRQKGYIPAVIYGRHDDNVHLNIEQHEFKTKYHYEASLIDFKLDSSADELKGIIRSIQRDPVTHDPIHIDFQHVHFGVPIEIDVNLNFVGVAVGTKLGGVFEEHMRSVHIRCLPSRIPEHFDVPITKVELGQSLHISDLVIPEGVELLADPAAVIATVVIPKGMKSEEEETSKSTQE
jgi:large subunit ribosomal protein L25